MGGGVQPRLFLYLFDHTIAPTLNYAPEIWGFDKWSILETLHLKAIKYALGVRSSTTTDAVYAELGRVSLQCHRHINILNLFARLSSLESKRYASKALSMLTKDADYGRYNWVSHARNLRVRYEYIKRILGQYLKLRSLGILSQKYYTQGGALGTQTYGGGSVQYCWVKCLPKVIFLG